MTRIIYVNGRYLPYAAAGVHAEDRGFQFADAVYEVCEVKAGRLIDETRHMPRLGATLYIAKRSGRSGGCGQARRPIRIRYIMENNYVLICSFRGFYPRRSAGCATLAVAAHHLLALGLFVIHLHQAIEQPHAPA